MAQAPPLVGAGRMVAVFALATLATAALAYAAAALLRLKAASVGVFTQACFRGNLGFVGLPVVQLVADGDAPTVGRAVLVFAPAMVLYNVLGVAGLSLAGQRSAPGAVRRLIVALATNPLLIAAAVGVALLFAPLRPPVALLRTLELLGDTAAPLALISLGGAVVSYPIRSHLLAASAASLLKLAALPAVTFLLAAALGVPDGDRAILLIFAATPTAVASYVLAVKLGGDPALAAGTIALSTLLSVVSLATVLALV